MLFGKKNERKNLPVVRRTDIPGTLEGMVPGVVYWTKARDFAPLTSVRAAVSRLNANAGRTLYEVSTDDNGESYLLVRN